MIHDQMKHQARTCLFSAGFIVYAVLVVRRTIVLKELSRGN